LFCYSDKCRLGHHQCHHHEIMRNRNKGQRERKTTWIVLYVTRKREKKKQK